MRQAMRNKTLIYLTAFLFSVILASCGGGTQGLDEYGTSSTGSASGSNNSPLPTGNKSVTLNWTPPASYTDGSNLADLRGHYIYKKTGSGSFVKIGDVSILDSNNTTYVATNLSTGTTYTFAVTAYNSAGLESGFSKIVTVSL